ncbi:hypothetical protein [Paraburkholderia tropica]|uniref:hypothetical protein n=1 Tax=Paraburkholderia tropica TaxID=92647 RepID=UPI001F2C80D3|nr:hypothetical protein [Paraburkholderia tropica]
MKEFRSFGAFAKHLEVLALQSHAVKEHVLDKSAEEIQKTAQGLIGQYQEAIGPYVAWDELADSTQAERARLGFSENDPGYRDGAMQRSIGRQVHGEESVIGSNDKNLVWFDQGTSKQPPRPVFGPAAIHSLERVKLLQTITLIAWIAGKGWRRPRLTSGG